MTKSYMTQAEYARYRGVCSQVVYDNKKTGKVIMTEQGRVDVVASDKAWKARESKTLRPDAIVQPNEENRIKNKNKQTNKKSETNNHIETIDMSQVDAFVGGSSIEQMECGEIDEKDLYVRSRAINEFLKAQKERIKLQQLEDTVIQRDDVLKAVQRISRQNRDMWLNWPKTVSIDMAAELGIEPRAMNDILSKFIRENLDRFATLDFQEWTQE